MGGTVLAAQYVGADDKQGQKDTVGTLFSLAFIASLIVTMISLLLYSPVFSLLNVPSVAMDATCGYMQIICMETVFVFGYNAVCSRMKGFGDSKTPLYFVVVAAVVNIVKSGSNYSIAEVPARYPMGEEHFLIEEILHTSIEKDQYPADFGILVLNLQSIYQISKITNNCYDGGRFITIADLSHVPAMGKIFHTQETLQLFQNFLKYTMLINAGIAIGVIENVRQASGSQNLFMY